MPLTPHIEHHFTGSVVVRDAVIGMSDGLTVPFALAAGLSGAVDATAIVVTADLAPSPVAIEPAAISKREEQGELRKQPRARGRGGDPHAIISGTALPCNV